MSDIDKQPHGLILTPGSYTGELLMTEEEKRAINPPSANYADSTTKCPMCGAGEDSLFGQGLIMCKKCHWTSPLDGKEMELATAYHAALHRIRELEARCEESERNRVIVHTPPLPESVVFDALRSQTQQWQEEVMRMRVRMADMHKRIKDLEAENARLREAMRDAFIEGARVGYRCGDGKNFITTAFDKWAREALKK